MRILYVPLLFVIVNTSFAQKLALPYNVKKAYENGTRSYKGVPGEKYFQNRAVYSIKASFDPEKGTVNGKEEIVYFNNSDVSLSEIVIRLYQDVFKKGNKRDEPVPEAFLTDGMVINSVKVNDVELGDGSKVINTRSGTNFFLSLVEDIKPKDSTIINIDWQTKMPPAHAHRFGKYGEGDWFVALWYPQIAVYDDIDRWDVWSYTGLYEFYNDFNDYNVEIEVPAGHMVWATGSWVNAAAILSPEIYEKYQESLTSDESIQILSSGDLLSKKAFKKRKKLKFKFQARHVPDFAFAVSDSYLWDAGSVITDSVSKERTVVNAVYPSEARNFDQVAKLGMESVSHFTFNSLGVKYPYPNVTVFNGEGGMEYPMMVNQADGNLSSLTFVTMHEIFHGYFPFYTGTNERKYAWVDEGLTTYLPVGTELEISESPVYQLPLINQSYNYNAGEEKDLPLFIPSAFNREASYGHHAYFRPAVAFSVVERYLGKETFRKSIREFVDRWNGKHPTGYDLLFTLNDIAGEDLSWLTVPWFSGYGWADLGIKKVERQGNNLVVTIENIGGFPVPVELKFIGADGRIVNKAKKADCWKTGNEFVKIGLEKSEDIIRIELGSPFIPDKESKNDYYYFNK